ncbi:MAG TPA: peptidoglycan-binding protein [Rubricoccaceae bacterium]|jgi:hypothetical protein
MALLDFAELLAPPDAGVNAALPIVAGVRRHLGPFDPEFAKSETGRKLFQELLIINGYDVGKAGADGDHGKDTRKAAETFQRAKGIPVTGVNDAKTHEALVGVIVRAARVPSSGQNIRAAIVAVALGYATAGAREISPNRGPWVRFFMSGNEGAAWAWCAGFASLVWIQAAAAFGATQVEQARRFRSFSCDVLGSRGASGGLLVDGAAVAAGRASIEPGDMFLVQSPSNPRDYMHTGIVIRRKGDGTIDTVEGNTNAAGGREGLFVLRRNRRVTAHLDFVRCPFAA